VCRSARAPELRTRDRERGGGVGGGRVARPCYGTVFICGGHHPSEPAPARLCKRLAWGWSGGEQGNHRIRVTTSYGWQIAMHRPPPPKTSSLPIWRQPGDIDLFH
jgi:hypothetical protein